mgnify:CR=1 FL=1
MVSVDFDWANWKAHELDQFNTGLIGIDRIFDQFKQTQQNVQTNYPPYNIVKVGEGDYKYVIEMAVAGHTMDSIDVTVEKQVLSVKGSGAEKTDTNYIHKGTLDRRRPEPRHERIPDCKSTVQCTICYGS